MVGNVQTRGGADCVVALHCVDGALRFVLVRNVGDCDPCTALGQLERNAAANAARATRDEGRSTFEIAPDFRLSERFRERRRGDFRDRCHARLLRGG